jgi:hypothetical protein
MHSAKRPTSDCVEYGAISSNQETRPASTGIRTLTRISHEFSGKKPPFLA